MLHSIGNSIATEATFLMLNFTFFFLFHFVFAVFSLVTVKSSLVSVFNFQTDNIKSLSIFLHEIVVLDFTAFQALLELVQEVLSKVEALTNKAGEIAFTSGVEQKSQEQIMLSKGSLEGASLNLKSVAHLLAPVAANDPVSKQQLSRATDTVVQRVKDVVNNVQPNCPDTDTVNEVLGLSHQLHTDLGNLGSFIHTLGTGDQSNASSQFSQINALMQKVRYNMDKQDQDATVNALKHLMVSCNYLIKQAKTDASDPNVDKDQRDSIVMAAQGLAGSMRTLLQDIKTYQSDGGKPLSREEVTAILKGVQNQVNELCKEDAMRDVFMKLEVCSRFFVAVTIRGFSNFDRLGKTNN